MSAIARRALRMGLAMLKPEYQTKSGRVTRVAVSIEAGKLGSSFALADLVRALDIDETDLKSLGVLHWLGYLGYHRVNWHGQIRYDKKLAGSYGVKAAKAKGNRTVGVVVLGPGVKSGGAK
jgi:hypothetical protein